MHYISTVPMCTCMYTYQYSFVVVYYQIKIIYHLLLPDEGGLPSGILSHKQDHRLVVKICILQGR